MSKVTHISHNNLGKDKTLVTHTDLDGIGCALVFLKAFPQGVVFFASNHNVNQIINDEILDMDDGCDVLISDLSVDELTAKRLDQRGKVGLLDHHRTAKWLADKYEWAQVADDKCGTRLVYEMLGKWFNLEDLARFVDVVEDWDLWGGGNGPGDEAIVYQFLFEFMDRRDFLQELLKDVDFPLNDQWAWLAEKLIERYEDYYQVTRSITQIHTSGDYLVGIALADQYVSLIGGRLCEELDLEYIMIIDNRNGSASLRGKGNIDLSELAKRAGGGGHRRAAGFPLGGMAVELVNQIEGDGHGSPESEV